MLEQENQRVLYGMVYKLLAETEEENLYICDGKNDELYELCKDYLELPNVESDSPRIGETVKKIEKDYGATIRQ